MPDPVYLIVGDEFLASRKAQDLIASLVPPENRDFGLEIIDGNAGNGDEALKALRRCREAVQTAAFMGNGKVVWFRDVSFLGDSKTAAGGDVLAAVEAFVEGLRKGLPQGHTLIITAPKVDKRRTSGKNLAAASRVEDLSVAEKPRQKEEQAQQWAAEAFRKAGVNASSEVLVAFVNRAGYDPRQIVIETEKLSVYLAARREARLEDIKAVVSPTRETLAWDLADAVGRRRLPEALAILRQLLFQKENVMGLLIGLESRFRDLTLYKEAVDRGWVQPRGYSGWQNVPPDIAALLADSFKNDPRKAHPYRVGQLADQAKLFSRRDLEKCRTLLMETHEQMVTNRIPDDIALELLIVRMLA